MRLPNIAPYITSYAPSTYQGHNINVAIIGSTQELQNTLRIQLQTGRFISLLDHYASFAVIGQKIYQNLLAIDASDPIGKQIQIGNSVFTIIGIVKDWPQNSFFDQDINQSVVIPIEATGLLSNMTSINNIIFTLKNHAKILTRLMQLLAKLLISKLAIKNFSFVALSNYFKVCKTAGHFNFATGPYRQHSAGWRDWHHEYHAGFSGRTTP